MLSSLLVVALSAVAAAQYSLTQLHQFPSPPAGQYTNLENIALRTSNGQLLITPVTGRILYQLNPAAPVPEFIIEIPAPVQGILGIAETHKGSDVYAIGGGNFTIGPQIPGGITGVPGSFYIFVVDLSGPKAVYKKAIPVPGAGFLNGVVAVPGCDDVVLAADSLNGAIWSINVKTGATSVLISDPQFLPTPEFSLGINGIHIQGSTLYWTNSAQNSYGKLALAIGKYGQVSAAGAVQKIASTPSMDVKYDDFALDHNGNAWIASPENAITRVSSSGEVAIVAGGGNSTTLVSPTSAVFGLNGCTLYITTGGQGFPPGREQSGGVYVLDTCKSKRSWRA